MIYISDKQQERIRSKINRLPGVLRHPLAAILFFELLGTLVFAYGTCVARYLHPIEQRHLNPTFHFLISSFYYFALSIATPFSGGHLNPAVAAAFHRLRANAHLWQEIAAQVLGAVLGTGIAYGFFGVVPYFYWEEASWSGLLLDLAGETFGTFVFVFFMLVITETNYMAGEYFRYMLISIFLLAGRIFTLRRGALNPVLALAFQLFAAIDNRNFLLFLPDCLPLLVGPVLGALLAVGFFRGFYAPLKEGLAAQKLQASLEEGV